MIRPNLRKNPATGSREETGRKRRRWIAKLTRKREALWCTKADFLFLLLEIRSGGESTSSASASDLERSRSLGLPPPPGPGMTEEGPSTLSSTDFLRPRWPERESTRGGITRSTISTSAGEEGEFRVGGWWLLEWGCGRAFLGESLDAWTLGCLGGRPRLRGGASMPPEMVKRNRSSAC
jgi:hypothetical protein